MPGPSDRPGTLSRRALLAGVTGFALLPIAPALAAGAAPRMTLPIGPFLSRALARLVAEGRLRPDDPVARHLDGIGAFRAADGAPLTVGDLAPGEREVDRFLAATLVEQLSGEPLAAHLQRRLHDEFGGRDARLLGTSPVVAIDCRAEDGLRWLAG